MSGVELPPADPRHPAWCSWRRCGASRADGLGAHRSELVPIERAEPYDARVTVWLSQTIGEPLDESEVWVHVRAEYATRDEVREVHSEDFRLGQAEQLGATMVLLARRGRERRYVAEDEWRQPHWPDSPDGPAGAS
jgi:hypothetical protein